jgi:hypothetical protein
MIMGIFCDNDINLIMSYLEPRKFHFKGYAKENNYI